MILALPFTAILKVILDSNKNLEPFGYLLGEPEQEVAEEIAMEQQAAIKKKRRNQNSRRRKAKPVEVAPGNTSQSA